MGDRAPFRNTSAHQWTYGKHPSNPAACDYRPRDQARLGSRSLPPPSSSPLAARKLAKGLTGSFRATLPQSMSVHRQRHHRRGRGRGAEAPHPLPLQGAPPKKGTLHLLVDQSGCVRVEVCSIDSAAIRRVRQRRRRVKTFTCLIQTGESFSVNWICGKTSGLIKF